MTRILYVWRLVKKLCQNFQFEKFTQISILKKMSLSFVADWANPFFRSPIPKRGGGLVTKKIERGGGEGKALVAGPPKFLTFFFATSFTFQIYFNIRAVLVQVDLWKIFLVYHFIISIHPIFYRNKNQGPNEIFFSKNLVLHSWQHFWGTQYNNNFLPFLNFCDPMKTMWNIFFSSHM